MSDATPKHPTPSRERITREQAAVLGEKIGPMMSYARRVRQRMDATGLQNDELYELVDDAFDALHRLSVALHYRSVGSGCGQGTTKPLDYS